MNRKNTRRRRGTGFLILTTLPLLGVYLFTSIYVIQCIALLLLLLLCGAKAYSEYLIRNILIRRRDRELREFRYQWLTVELTAENHGRLPAFMLAVSDNPGMLPVFRDNKTIHTLKPRSRIVLRWQAYCSDRGVFTLGPALIRGADPLGIFPFSIRQDRGAESVGPEQTKLYVYPAPALAALKPPGGLPLGALITPNPLYEDLTRGRSLREYRNGDEPRRINWKASARTGSLMVNEYESTLSYPLVIFLNLDPAEYPLKKREIHIERGIETAAALCLLASRERQALGIIIYDPQGAEPVSVTAPASFTLIPIMERLAGLERAAREKTEPPRGSGPANLRGSAQTLLEQGKYLPYGSRLVYTGPDLGGGDYQALNSLRAYHLSLEYLILDERSLSSVVPGGSRRYQVKEQGYEIT